MDTSRNVLKARCDSTGLMIRFIFWAYAIYLVAMTAVGLVLVFRPEGDFSLSLASGRDGMGGYGFFYGGLMNSPSAPWNTLSRKAGDRCFITDSRFPYTGMRGPPNQSSSAMI